MAQTLEKWETETTGAHPLPVKVQQALVEIEKIKRSITKTSRFRSITSVLIKHGLLYVLRDSGILSLFGKKRSKEEDEQLRRIGERLRLAFEELGPTFIKLGQVLVTRQELLPEPITSELAKLLDQVPPMPFHYIYAAIEQELPEGMKTFAWFDAKPIGSASLAQVYKAKLHDGRHVAVKVVRPTVQKLFETDIKVINMLVRQIQKRLPVKWRAAVDLPGLIKDYYSSSINELDMVLEARTMNEHREIAERYEKVHIPEVYLSSKHVMVMEFVDGWTIKEFPVDFFTFEERLQLMLDLAHYYIDTFLRGNYHADAHGSNIMIDRRSRKAVVIDWGMTGKMDTLHTDAIFRMLMHIRVNQAEDAAECAMDIVDQTIYTDSVRLRDDFRSMMIQYVNSPQGDMRFNWGALVISIITIGMKHFCKIPNGLALWAKGFSATEGTARWLCPEISYHTVVETADIPIIREALGRRFNYHTNTSLLTETSKLVGTLPRRLNKILERLYWNNMKFHIELKMEDEMRHVLTGLVNRLSLALLIAALFVGSSLLVMNRTGVVLGSVTPVNLAVGAMSAGLVLSVRLLWNMWRRKGGL